MLDWQRLKVSTGSDPFEALAANWRFVVRAAKDQLELEKAGLAPAASHDSRNHLVDVVCLEGVEVWRWVPRVVAMHLLQDERPGEFASDQAFFVQIGKLVWMKRLGVREVGAGLPRFLTSMAEQRGQLPSVKRRDAMGRTLSAYAGRAIAHSIFALRRDRKEQQEAAKMAEAVFSVASG